MRSAVKFNLSEKYDTLRDLAELMEKDGCAHVLDHYSKEDLDHYAQENFHLQSKDPVELCKKIVEHVCHPVLRLKRKLNSEKILFSPEFFHFAYHPGTGEKPSPSGHSGLSGKREVASWQEALDKVDEEKKWIDKIYKQLNILNETPTGNTILKLIATLYVPREIRVTNENPSRLSANVHTYELNIPSVPRFICYYDPKKNLINSQLWMALGHELIHLVHSKLGLHYNSSSDEEENTVQGLVTENDHVDHSLIEVDGKQWYLTENKFRAEHEIPRRNGYDSIPVCSTFEKSGCDLFNSYGDDTCMVLQNSQEPEIRSFLSALMEKKKKFTKR